MPVALEIVLLAALVAAVAGGFFARRLKRARELAAWMQQKRLELTDAARGEYLNWAKAKRVLSDAPQVEQSALREVIDTINEEFVAQRLIDSKALFDKRELTQAQRLAVVRDEDANLINAGAGSGKTRTIVGKVEYLIARKLATPGEILVLAYNRKIKAEIAAKMETIAPGVTVRTVHALGLDIVKKVEGASPQLSEFAEDDTKLGRFLMDIMRDMLSGSTLLQTLVAFFSTHLFGGNPEQGVTTKDEYFRKIRRVGMRALDGTRLKSHQEVQIANWLILSGIKWEYEKQYPHGGKRRYKPDFYLPDYKIWIEHFGVDERGNTAPWINRAKYQAQMQWKRELHNQNQTTLVETYSYEAKQGGLAQALEDKLAEYDVKKKPLSDGAINQMVRERYKPIPTFIKLVQQFLALCRENKFTGRALMARATDSRDRVFLELFDVFRARYEKRLKADGKIDFTDMIVRALKYVQSSQYRSPFKYILVDEYQDITKVRLELVLALQQQVEDARLFCVGDDWQSIYRFQGADVSLITHFGDYVDAYERTDLDKTFRYSQALNEFSVMFITKNPAQLAKAVESDIASDEKPVRVVYHLPDEWEEKLRDAIDFVAANSSGEASCLMLGRYHHDKPDAWHRLKRRADSNNVSLEYSTIHAAKGREVDWVIVAANKSGADGRGFPSEIEDDPILNMLLPEGERFNHAEERRLFYVAVTRARKGVFLFAPSGEASAFIREIDPTAGVDVNDNIAINPYAPYVVSEGGSDARVFVCPECKGQTIRKKPTTTGGEFYACTNYPGCLGVLPSCPNCAAPIPIAQVDGDDRYVCECNTEVAICPQCREGVMQERNSRYGTFWGCSRFAATDCNYKSNRRYG